MVYTMSKLRNHIVYIVGHLRSTACLSITVCLACVVVHSLGLNTTTGFCCCMYLKLLPSNLLMPLDALYRYELHAAHEHAHMHESFLFC